MSVKLQPGSRFEAGVPAKLFEMPVPDLVPAFPNSYVATADGQRFLVNTVVPDAPSSPISVVMNWAAELPRARFDN
jgi:hypothetical protein